MEKKIIDFSSPDEQALWKIINDAVMGGVSSNRISIIDNNAALFHGVISLENFGGFTSMRTLFREFELTGLTNLILRIKGDGKGYRLRLRTDEAYEGIAYQDHYSTEQDTWITVCLSFETCTPVFRGEGHRRCAIIRCLTDREAWFHDRRQTGRPVPARNRVGNGLFIMSLLECI